MKDIPSKWIDGEPFLGCRKGDYVLNQEGDYIYGEAKGKIAIVGRGQCYFWEKVKIANEAGAIGIIIINRLIQFSIVKGGHDLFHRLLNSEGL